MTTARPLTGAEIIELVGEVPERLEPGGTHHVVIIVGGSLLAWRGPARQHRGRRQCHPLR